MHRRRITVEWKEQSNYPISSRLSTLALLVLFGNSFACYFCRQLDLGCCSWIKYTNSCMRGLHFYENFTAVHWPMMYSAVSKCDARVLYGPKYWPDHTLFLGIHGILIYLSMGGWQRCTTWYRTDIAWRKDACGSLPIIYLWTISS